VSKNGATRFLYRNSHCTASLFEARQVEARSADEGACRTMRCFTPPCDVGVCVLVVLRDVSVCAFGFLRRRSGATGRFSTRDVE
jgi:hypothetical protein